MKCQMMLVEILHHLATTGYFCGSRGPSWLLFENGIASCVLSFRICCASWSYEVIAPIFFESPNKLSNSFPRWRCASCDSHCGFLTFLNIWRNNDGDGLRMGASVMEFNVLAEEVVRSKVSDLAGRFFERQKGVVLNGEDDVQISWRKVARNGSAGVTQRISYDIPEEKSIIFDKDPIETRVVQRQWSGVAGVIGHYSSL